LDKGIRKRNTHKLTNTPRQELKLPYILGERKMARGRKTHPLALAKKKYARHKAQAKYRNIEFKFSFDEWYQWWLNNGVDKNTDTFNKADTGRLCMCRHGDVGAYEPTNVYCDTMVKNAQHLHENKPSQKLIYRYAADLVTLTELCDRLGYTPARREHWHHTTYDYYRNTEARQLTNRFRQTYGTLRTRTEYHSPRDRTWYPTVKAACAASKMDPGTYKKRLRLEYEGYESRVTRTLEDYIRANTRYPDPIIPKDI